MSFENVSCEFWTSEFLPLLTHTRTADRSAKDGSGSEYLHLLRRSGNQIYRLAKNIVPGQEGAKWVGACFSPDGKTSRDYSVRQQFSRFGVQSMIPHRLFICNVQCSCHSLIKTRAVEKGRKTAWRQSAFFCLGIANYLAGGDVTAAIPATKQVKSASLLLVSRVIGWIDVFNLPGADTVELHHCLSFGPRKMFHARGPEPKCARWHRLCGGLIELVTRSQIEGPANHRDVLDGRMRVRENFESVWQ